MGRGGAAVAFVACLLAAGLVPAVAGAATTVDSLTTSLSSTQAGRHANLDISFAFETSGDPEIVREVKLGLPPGFFMVPYWNRCSQENLASSECPNGSKVGLITIYAEYEGDPSHVLGTEPVYMVDPSPDELVRLGVAVPFLENPIEASVQLRTGSDHGLDLTFEELADAIPVSGAKLSLWGVPNHPSHDTSRPSPGECFGMASCITPQRPSGSIPLPFLTNPTRCGVPLDVTLEAHTYEQPSQIISDNGDVATITGCNQLPFSPSLDAVLTTERTNAASGLDVDLRLPGASGVELLEPAAVRWLGVALPPVSVVAPTGAAAGICTDAEFNLETDEAAACPAGSRVGSLSLEIGGVGAPLEGEAFLGESLEEGVHLLLLEASGSGALVKLLAYLEPALEGFPPILELEELPQIPIRELQLNVGEGAELLVTPPTCGTRLGESAIESWASGAFVLFDHQFPITVPGPAGWTCAGPPPPPIAPPTPRPRVSPVPPPIPVRAPKVRITTDPPKRTARHRMKFRFVPNHRAAGFECKLDKARWRPCISPKVVRKLRPGRHVFKVRAVGPTGDRGPADKAVWRVVAGDRRGGESRR